MTTKSRSFFRFKSSSDDTKDEHVEREITSSFVPSIEDERAAIPDGGFRAWLQVLGASFVYFNSWGFINTFGTFETYYITILPQKPSNIAWIGTAGGFLLVFIGVITGSVHDRGFFRPLLIGGSFLIVFGLMMTSLCTKYYQFMLAQGICLGLGFGSVFLPSLVVVATYFSKNRGFATGIAASAGQLGGVIYPIMFRQLNPRLGFGWTIRIFGFVALGMLAITNVIMKPRVPPTRKQLLDITAFRDPAYLLFCFGLFTTFTGLYQPLYYTPTFGEVKLGESLGSAFYLTAITNACSIAGCILPSIISDWVGPLNLIIPAGLLTSMLAFVWISIKTIPTLQALVAFYGFFTGILISLPNPILVSLSPSLDRVGSRVGIGYTFAAFGLLIGSPLGGLLINIPKAEFLHDQLWGGFWVLGGTLFFAASRFWQWYSGATKSI